MRVLYVVVALVLGMSGVAGAAPKNTGPTMSEQAELDRLQKQQYELQGKQKYAEAVKVARKAYLLQKKVSGEEARETRHRKQALATLLVQTMDYGEAEKIYKEMLATAEKQHGPESRETHTALMMLSTVYWPLNNYGELDKLYARQVALAKKLDGELSSEYASALATWGTLLNMRHEYGAAVRLMEESLRIRDAIAPAKDDISFIAAQQGLASLYWMTNQQGKAIALFDTIVKTLDASKNASLTVMYRASTVWGIAAQYHYSGRDDLARPLMKRAIDMYEKEVARIEKTNPDDYMLSGLLGQLGMNYRQSGDFANAEKVLVKAVAVDEKRGQFSGYAATLAELKRVLGKPREALALLEKAQAALTKLSPSMTTTYNMQMADVLRELGDFKRAESLLIAHRASVEKQYGKKHPAYGLTQLGIARVYMMNGHIPQAEKLLADAFEAAERELSLVLKTGTESDHAIYFARNSYVLDLAVDFHPTYASKSTSAVRMGLTTLLRRKGRVLDAAAASLATIRSKLSPDDKKLLDELAAARAKLAKLMVAGAQGSPDDYQKEIAALEAQIQKLELQIGKKSAAYRATTQAIELPAVQKLIPRDAKLVEIVNYQPSDPKQSYTVIVSNMKLPARRYGAYVVGATGDPSFVDLGPAAAIDAAVDQLRKSIADPRNKQAITHAKALHALTMAKIAPRLGTAKNVLIAPDGTLNLVPFSALVDDKGEFLIKRLTFTYLTSGRDLLRLALKTQAQGGGVIFADPTFDHGAPAPRPSGQAPTPAPGTRGARSADLASLLWPQLPGTAAEATAIEKTMRGLKVFRGKDATENALKQVHGPKILHLATHGFFLADEPPRAGAADQRNSAPAMGPMSSATAPPPTSGAENPLLRSGLAMAGANKLVSGDEDGILTAMEASGLDLWGTKLVVLSACETGAGKVTNGDGVYGLRRALVIAGAESLVMTLWQVDDEATKELMTGYYKQLSAGKGRSAALRDTQLEILSRKNYEHPFFWASFLPAGDMSPLK